MNANRMDRQVARDIATTVFEGTRWLASEEDMERLTLIKLLLTFSSVIFVTFVPVS